MFDAIFGVMLKDDSNLYSTKLKAASSIEEYDLFGQSSDWESEVAKAFVALGEEFIVLLSSMRNRFGDSFFSESKIEKLFSDSKSDSKNDLPGIDDVTEVVFKAYRKGIITYSELESVWGKTKKMIIYLAPNITYMYLAPIEKFYPEQSKLLFNQKLEDYINRNDEL